MSGSPPLNSRHQVIELTNDRPRESGRVAEPARLRMTISRPCRMSRPREVHVLLQRLNQAQGRDIALDRKIAQDLDVFAPMTQVPEHNASVDGCLHLLHRLQPGRRWHLGSEASRVMPHVFASNDECRFETTARMVPLALLIVITQARLVLDADPAP